MESLWQKFGWGGLPLELKRKIIRLWENNRIWEILYCLMMDKCRDQDALFSEKNGVYVDSEYFENDLKCLHWEEVKESSDLLKKWRLKLASNSFMRHSFKNDFGRLFTLKFSCKGHLDSRSGCEEVEVMFGTAYTHYFGVKVTFELQPIVAVGVIEDMLSLTFSLSDGFLGKIPQLIWVKKKNPSFIDKALKEHCVIRSGDGRFGDNWSRVTFGVMHLLIAMRVVCERKLCLKEWTK